MKILIIRFSSIGDIVLTTPVIRCLKQQLAHAEIHFLTKYSFRDILEANPYIDKLILLRTDWAATMHELKNEHYDVVIDLHHNLRTLRVKRTLKVKQTFSFNKLNTQKWLLTALKVNRLPKMHIVGRYLDAVKKLGVQNDGKGLDYFIPEKDKVALQDIPTTHQFGFIGIVIGAALATKRMPLHKLKTLCEQISYPIILLGGPEDKKDGDAIASADNIKIYNACGKFSLNESADLVQQSKLIITHDTGLMHIAAALQKKIISIWGNTVPEFGMGAYYGNKETRDLKFEVLNLSCRPCSKIGYKQCPKKHFKCMELQNVEAIANEAIRLIQ